MHNDKLQQLVTQKNRAIVKGRSRENEVLGAPRQESENLQKSLNKRFTGRKGFVNDTRLECRAPALHIRSLVSSHMNQIFLEVLVVNAIFSAELAKREELLPLRKIHRHPPVSNQAQQPPIVGPLYNWVGSMVHTPRKEGGQLCSVSWRSQRFAWGRDRHLRQNLHRAHDIAVTFCSLVRSTGTKLWMAS